MKLPFHSVVRMATVTAVISAALTALTSLPASAAVSAVRGSAYGYTANVSLGNGGPYERQGFGQVTCTGGAQVPAGCTDPSTAATSASPAVSLPPAGGNVTQTDPDGAQAKYGPAALFGGKWPPSVAVDPPSGPITVRSTGTTGPGGSVTSSVDIVLYTPASATVPGGVGPPPIEADEVHSTCSASESSITASTTIVNGVLAVATDASGEPTTSQPIPIHPPVNYVRGGEISNVGDGSAPSSTSRSVTPTARSRSTRTTCTCWGRSPGASSSSARRRVARRLPAPCPRSVTRSPTSPATAGPTSRCSAPPTGSG